MRAVWSTAVPIDARPVFYISTSKKDMFGLHQRRHDGTYASHVITFTVKEHAEVVAKGLEKFHTQHGAFPSRETDMDSMNLPSDVDGVVLDKVSVHSTNIEDLVARLAGTAICLTLVRFLEDDATFEFHDLRPDSSPKTTRDALQNNWNMTPDCELQNSVVSVNLKMDISTGIPMLLPKPMRFRKKHMRGDGIVTMFVTYVLMAEFAMAAALMKAFL